MDTALPPALTAEEVVETETALTRIIEQISEIREQMKADDVAIARLKAETAILKAESQTLREETRAILAHLPGGV